LDAVKPEAFPQPDYAENCWAILFLKIDDGVNMSLLMEKKWLEMIQAFSKLTLEERVAESEKRLDDSNSRSPLRKFFFTICGYNLNVFTTYCVK
jgi:hypothetical protein